MLRSSSGGRRTMSCSECSRDDAIICSMLCRSTRGARARPARTGSSIARPRAARASELTDSVTVFVPSSMVPSTMAPSSIVAPEVWAAVDLRFAAFRGGAFASIQFQKPSLSFQREGRSSRAVRIAFSSNNRLWSCAAPSTGSARGRIRALVRRRLPRPACRQRLERLAGLGEDRTVSSGGLVAPNDHVDIERIDLDAATDTTRGLGGDEDRAGAEKRVDDDVAAVGQIDKGVFQHGGRLDGRVVFEAAAGVGAQRRGARIGPDVRTPAAAFAEFDVVDVRGGAGLEQRQQLMLGPIEAAHAGIGLGPDNEVQGDQADLQGRRVDRRQAPPVDEGAEDAAIAETGSSGLHPRFVEVEKFGVGHLARGHGEFAVLAAGHMPGDRDVVRFVGQDEAGGRIALHQPPERLGIGGAAASETVRPELENVAEASDCDRTSFWLERTLLHRVPGVAEYDLVDLVGGEAGDLNWSIAEDQLFELDL